MGIHEGEASVDLRTDVPHSARVYDYLLGGKDNFEADRRAAADIVARIPWLPGSSRANRAFVGRATRFVAGELGVRQFLDIGTGLPTSPNLHEAAQAVAPESRVVYVDNDPIVLVHARALLEGRPEGRTAYLDADLYDPASILESAQLHDTLNLERPVALSLIAILHLFTDDDQARGLVHTILAALAPGSVLTLTCVPDDRERTEDGYAAFRAHGLPMRARTPAEFARYFEGMDLIEPGIVRVNRWRSDEPDDGNPHMWAGVAVKR